MKKFESFRFRGKDYHRGPHVQIIPEGAKYKDGDALGSVRFTVEDEYAALTLLQAAREAVDFYRAKYAAKLKMIDEAAK